MPNLDAFVGAFSCFSKSAIKEIFHISSPYYLILSISLVLATELTSHEGVWGRKEGDELLIFK